MNLRRDKRAKKKKKKSNNEEGQQEQQGRKMRTKEAPRICDCH